MLTVKIIYLFLHHVWHTEFRINTSQKIYMWNFIDIRSTYVRMCKHISAMYNESLKFLHTYVYLYTCVCIQWIFINMYTYIHRIKE